MINKIKITAIFNKINQIIIIIYSNLNNNSEKKLYVYKYHKLTYLIKLYIKSYLYLFIIPFFQLKFNYPI